MFHCRRCGNCCRWSGCVRIREQEIDPIAACLGLTAEEFLDRFCRISPDRQALSLVEREDGGCIFLEDDGPGQAACRIQQEKPEQCRTFPERWNFPGWQKECPGGQTEEKSAEPMQ